MLDLLRQRSTQVTDESGLRQFMDEFEQRWEERTKISTRLNYERLTTKKPNPRLAEMEKELAEVFRSPQLAELVDRFTDQVGEERLASRLERYQSLIRTHQVEGDPEVIRLRTQVSDGIMAFRYPVDGEEHTVSDIRHILRHEADRERRHRAWTCESPLAIELRPLMLDLYRRRNQLAQEMGYAHSYELALELQGNQFDPTVALINRLLQETESEYRTVLAEKADKAGIKGELEPWDIQFLLEGGEGMDESYFPKSKLTPRLEAFARLHGVPMDKLGIKPEYFDIPWNGVCMRVGERKDIRIICNPQDGFTYYSTMLHELGHGLHSALNDQPELVFHRDPSPSAEGMAEVFGYFSRSPEWLADIGLPADTIDSTLRAAVAPWLFFLRQRSGLGLFGFEAYVNPEQDLDQKMGEIFGRVTGCRADATPRWSANSWFIGTTPWINYIIADMVASQIHRAFADRFPKLYGNPEWVTYLKDHYMALGTSVPWRKKLENCTGSDLNTEGLILDLKEAVNR